MKKASGMIVLVLACLLVAASVSASAIGALNAADDTSFVSMIGTKINIQEEVGGTFTAETMTALAVDPRTAPAVSIANYDDQESGVSGIRYVAYYTMSDSYKPTPGAGGDGLFARFS